MESEETVQVGVTAGVGRAGTRRGLRTGGAGGWGRGWRADCRPERTAGLRATNGSNLNRRRRQAGSSRGRGRRGKIRRRQRRRAEMPGRRASRSIQSPSGWAARRPCWTRKRTTRMAMSHCRPCRPCSSRTTRPWSRFRSRSSRRRMLFVSDRSWPSVRHPLRGCAGASDDAACLCGLGPRDPDEWSVRA